MKEYAVIIIVLALVVIGGLWAASARTARAPAPQATSTPSAIR